MTDRLLMLRVTLEAKAEALPIPTRIEQAHDYLRAGCLQFEMFAELEDAEAWAESFGGFRAEEVRKQLARYLARRAEFYSPLAA
jgi:hypothetical protein